MAKTTKTSTTKRTRKKAVPEPSGLEPHTDIIIVLYFNVSKMEPMQASTALIELRDGMRKALSFAAHVLVLPVFSGDTRIECINPRLLEKEEYKRVSRVIKNAEEAVDSLLGSAIDNLFSAAFEREPTEIKA
jgi:hypothetical protein